MFFTFLDVLTLSLRNNLSKCIFYKKISIVDIAFAIFCSLFSFNEIFIFFDISLLEEELKVYFNSQHVNGTICKHIVFLVGYLQRHQKTNNCVYEMSPFITLNDKLKRNYNFSHTMSLHCTRQHQAVEA